MDLRKELCEPFGGLRTETLDELEAIVQKYAEHYHNLQLHKTQVSGSVFVIQNKYTMIIHGCFKTKKKAEGYINGNINYEVIKLSVY